MAVVRMTATPAVHAAQDPLPAETEIEIEIAIEKETETSTPAALPLADVLHLETLLPSVAHHLQSVDLLPETMCTDLADEKAEDATSRVSLSE